MYTKIVSLASKNVERDAIGCFVAGTLVHTDKGLVPIEQIKVGDMVLSKPKNGEGELTYKPVLKIFDFEGKEIWIVKFTSIGCYPDEMFQSGKVTHCADLIIGTPNHPFWVVGEILYYDDFQLVLHQKPYWARLDQLGKYTVVLRADGILACVFAVQPVFQMTNQDCGFLQGYPLGDWWEYGDEDGYFIDFTRTPLVSSYKVSNNSAFSLPNDGDWCFPVKKEKVYNLEVADYHTYFVGQRGIFVHHKNCVEVTIESETNLNLVQEGGES